MGRVARAHGSLARALIAVGRKAEARTLIDEPRVRQIMDARTWRDLDRVLRR